MLPKARPNVPVIMVTAYGDEAAKKKAAEFGAAGLLTKPIDFGLSRTWNYPLQWSIDARLSQFAADCCDPDRAIGCSAIENCIIPCGRLLSIEPKVS